MIWTDEKAARLIATNPDNRCPVGSEKTRPGAGALGQRAFFENPLTVADLIFNPDPQEYRSRM